MKRFELILAVSLSLIIHMGIFAFAGGYYGRGRGHGRSMAAVTVSLVSLSDYGLGGGTGGGVGGGMGGGSGAKSGHYKKTLEKSADKGQGHGPASRASVLLSHEPPALDRTPGTQPPTGEPPRTSARAREVPETININDADGKEKPPSTVASAIVTEEPPQQEAGGGVEEAGGPLSMDTGEADGTGTGVYPGGPGGGGPGWGGGGGNGGGGGGGIIGLEPPEYPRYSRVRGEEGTVVISVEVLGDGSTGRVKVAKSSGHTRLDRAALQAVKGVEFIPAKLSNRGVTSSKLIAFRFNLKDARNQR